MWPGRGLAVVLVLLVGLVGQNDSTPRELEYFNSPGGLWVPDEPTDEFVNYLKYNIHKEFKNFCLLDLINPLLHLLERAHSSRNTTKPSSNSTGNMLDTDFGKKVVCEFCSLMLDIVVRCRRNGMPRADIEKFANKLCSVTGHLQPDVCEGLIRLNLGAILYIVDNKPDFSPKRACSIILQDQKCNSAPPIEWSVNIDNGPRRPVPLRAVERDIGIIQITDVHYDELYRKGASSNCPNKLILCCGENDGLPQQGESGGAGGWGDYGPCDIPLEVAVDTFQHSKTHKIDYVYFTGDIISHRMWNTSVEYNVNIINTVMNTLQSTYGKIPVFPILGNHETHPSNIFAPKGITHPQLSNQWLYEAMAKEWKRWLPAETESTIKQGGFYTVLVKPGFRIIALNNNVCYIYNWWISFDPVDHNGQLQWLANTLLSAENSGEFVHILAHIPPGDSGCERVWSSQYRAIFDRFSHIIRAEFNGHTHDDTFTLYYDKVETERPVSVAFSGGSVTTFTGNNPNYKYYTVDSSNMEVKNYATWAYNVKEANAKPNTRPVWHKVYDFKAVYGVKSMSPDSLRKLTFNLAINRTLLTEYYRYKSRKSEVFIKKGCKTQCQKKLLCSMAMVEFDDTTQCDVLVNAYTFSFTTNPENIFIDILNTIY